MRKRNGFGDDAVIGTKARPGLSRRRLSTFGDLPRWIQPQLSKLVDKPPDGRDWLHEIKFDGYRMHAHLDRGDVRLLTRPNRSRLDT